MNNKPMTAMAEALILKHIDLPRMVAGRMAKNFPAFVEMDELVSIGSVGLCEAAIRFDPELHASFQAWAIIRIRGSIIDAFRGRNYPRLMDQMPDNWLGEDPDGENISRLPSCLIDPAPSIEAQLIEQEQSVIVSINAGRARRELTPEEGLALDGHVSGLSMREIGAEQGRSGAWGHYTLHAAKRKMRSKLACIRPATVEMVELEEFAEAA